MHSLGEDPRTIHVEARNKQIMEYLVVYAIPAPESEHNLPSPRPHRTEGLLSAPNPIYKDTKSRSRFHHSQNVDNWSMATLQESGQLNPSTTLGAIFIGGSTISYTLRS